MNFNNTNVAASGAYTDFNRLHQLKVGEGRDSEANIRKVAQEFESLFLGEMMKAMRAAGDVLADDNFMIAMKVKPTATCMTSSYQ